MKASIERRLLETPERARAYVAAAQRDLNVHLRRLGSPTLLAVDGEWDDHTQLAFERVCRILGIDAGPDGPHVPPDRSRGR